LIRAIEVLVEYLAFYLTDLDPPCGMFPTQVNMYRAFTPNPQALHCFEFYFEENCLPKAVA